MPNIFCLPSISAGLKQYIAGGGSQAGASSTTGMIAIESVMNSLINHQNSYPAYRLKMDLFVRFGLGNFEEERLYSNLYLGLTNKT
jgi:hypothetical protein